MRGYVYILSNRAMPGLLKVGYTTRTLSEQLEAAYQKAYKFILSNNLDLEWAANSCAMNVSHKHFDTAIYNCFLNSGFALLKFGLEKKELDDMQFKKFLEITMYDDR
jgi:hypothetical protein